IAKIGDFTWDIKTGEVTWSDALYDMLQYDNSEKMDYKKVNAEIHHPDDLERITQWLNDCISSGEKALVPNEYRVIRKDGEILYVQTVGIIEHREGKSARVFATVQDITKHKQADDALIESRRQLTTLMDNLPGIAYRCLNKPGWPMEFISEGCHVITGYATAEFADTGNLLYGDLIHPKDQHVVWDTIQKSVRKGEPFVTEYRLRDRDGVEHWVWEQGRPVAKDHDGISFLEGFISDITERKRAEEEQEKLQAQLSNALEIAYLGHWEYDVTKDLFTFNDHFYKVFRTTAEEVGGYTISSAEYARLFVHPDDTHLVAEEIRKAIEATDPSFKRQLEHRMIYADGTVGYISVQFFIIKDAQGKTVKTYGVNQDITERKKAEEDLRESEKRFRTLFMSMNEGFYLSEIIYDDNGNPCDYRYLEVNPKFEQIIGLSRDEIIGKRYKELVPVDTTQWLNIYCKVALTGIPQRYYFYSPEYRIHFETYAYKPAKNQVTVFVIDITERKQAEEKLKDSEEKYRALYEEAPDGYIALDKDGRIINVNKKILEMFGYKQEEMLGKFLWNFVIEKEESRKTIKAKLSGHAINARNLERSYLCKDETVMPVLIDDIVIRTAEGEVEGLRAIIRDKTDLKKAEEEKEKLNQQLRQAQKMEAIGTLAGGVAHDFNNILTSIIGNADIALMTIDKDESLRKEIEEIKMAGEKAASLTRQLLAFSRKQIVQPKILDLNLLLASIEKMLIRLIGENVEIIMITEADLWQIEIDPGQMEQLIMNLVINAKDAMPNGGKITIQTANKDLDTNYFVEHGIAEEQPGSYVMVSVSDAGSGMDKETQEHIFEPFYTTKELGKGTGLGLSTVYGIIKQNRGFIWVYSELGQGSIFKIFLPRLKEGIKTEEKEQTPEENLSGSETVLIVEDDSALLNFAQKALHHYGYKVLTAKNGEDALRLNKKHEGPIDLLLTDVIMSKMSGKETAERLQPLYPRMKIIYMSGYTDNSIVHLGVLARGVNFLEKPFSAESLARKVREVLDK
ncbi:PAS domain S-box protein, partial [Deltaproteobacteria bacterium]|nr:PAS domain S-box protein [Deltaproteobacteria bacterium]